ncbi:OsmC family protein [Actibacterium sp. XHP0104]|uniref:OsmC family protein n=1 Tax=Actibacterium sp. XHP0104 TaxID=2984335 RepID=UPI0021E8BDCD|nr:OsmC family protein [Actibacterium sp. XHP0104]MCV2882986.1 OsmC family protein [Actibacterium sp. XHP0104]
MLNNVDVDALDGARQQIRETPEAGLATYGVNLAWQSGVRAEVTALSMTVGGEEIPRDYTWVVDEPPQLLGESKGPTPQEYLMSGVGACIMVGFVVNASVRGIEIRKLDVKVTGGLDLAGFLNLRDDAKVEMSGLTYEISVDCDADAETLAEVEAAAVGFSPNAMSVKNGIPVTGSVTRVAA